MHSKPNGFLINKTIPNKVLFDYLSCWNNIPIFYKLITYCDYIYLEKKKIEGWVSLQWFATTRYGVCWLLGQVVLLVFAEVVLL